MKNYYDELEVSRTASKEVIEKVYKILAKKYHPDTTKEIDKHLAEEKFKIISEAYEVLSNDEKRKKYDLELEHIEPTVSYEDYINVINQRNALDNAFNELKNEFYNFKNSYNTANQQQYYNNFGNSDYNNLTNNPNPQKYYYDTSTGEPVSTFEYFKYKIKEFISNIIFYLILILILLFLAKNIFSLNLNNFFNMNVI